jgi:hypothetical protein
VRYFFPNEPDNLHCLQACVRMLIAHVEDELLPLSKIEEITGFDPGLQSWPYAAMASLAERNYEVVYIEKFDHETFAFDPGKATTEAYGVESWELFKKISNISAAQVSALKCLNHKNVTFQNKVPKIEEIKDFLDNNCSIICNLNANKLSGLDGYNGHFVLICELDLQKGNLVIQNPGLPPMKDQVVTVERFLEAWSSLDSTPENIISLRKI